jgi:hypothetical protein
MGQVINHTLQEATLSPRCRAYLEGARQALLWSRFPSQALNPVDAALDRRPDRLAESEGMICS